MTYRRNYRQTGPRPRVVSDADIGTHVTLVVRKQPSGTLYVSGVVRSVSAQGVTLGVMHHPTGPWDRWESHEVPTPITHARIVRRA